MTSCLATRLSNVDGERENAALSVVTSRQDAVCTTKASEGADHPPPKRGRRLLHAGWTVDRRREVKAPVVAPCVLGWLLCDDLLRRNLRVKPIRPGRDSAHCRVYFSLRRDVVRPVSRTLFPVCRAARVRGSTRRVGNPSSGHREGIARARKEDGSPRWTDAPCRAAGTRPSSLVGLASAGGVSSSPSSERARVWPLWPQTRVGARPHWEEDETHTSRRRGGRAWGLTSVTSNASRHRAGAGRRICARGLGGEASVTKDFTKEL